MSAELIELYNWVLALGWRAVDFIVKFTTSPSLLQDYFKLGLILTITILLEIAARKNWRFRYGSKNFRVDLLYFVFYYGGIYHLFLWTVMYKAMIAWTTVHAPWLQMNLLSGMSPVWQVMVMLLVSDFVGYWSHRWRHSSKFLWNFHSIHHSQTNLTIVSNYRFHVVDETLLRLWLFIPFQILGTGVAIWMWLDLILAWILYLQHSEWKWTYGRLGYIFVSPSFHRKHHSTDERLQNSNYSMLFTFWDDLFGTADRKSPIPDKHGIEGNPVPETWLGQLVYPFAETWRDIRAYRDTRRRKREVAAAPPAEPAE
jgi:sterol desaturase/sphingolipid hydroxylase (fatty acid hydroxylase superfamily)